MFIIVKWVTVTLANFCALNVKYCMLLLIYVLLDVRYSILLHVHPGVRLIN
jgi:hypothetical protein